MKKENKNERRSGGNSRLIAYNVMIMRWWNLIHIVPILFGLGMLLATLGNDDFEEVCAFLVFAHVSFFYGGFLIAYFIFGSRVFEVKKRTLNITHRIFFASLYTQKIPIEVIEQVVCIDSPAVVRNKYEVRSFITALTMVGDEQTVAGADVKIYVVRTDKLPRWRPIFSSFFKYPKLFEIAAALDSQVRIAKSRI